SNAPEKKCKIMCHLKISAKAGIQFKNTGFPRVKHGAGLVKPGMTIKVKELLTQCSSLEFGVFIYNNIYDF
ncbi:MAG: hypothetical protein QME83_05690, partial [Thermodesulfobacteriota bacterium]|nr:hypothetical protein [Thermodesulfobacteriota bacterium]